LCRVFGLINFLNFAKINFKNREAKNKLKGSENETFTNVFNQRRSSGRFPLGKWNADFFKNDNPVVGARLWRSILLVCRDILIKNFIGIDIKGARFWRGAKQLLMKVYKCSFY
jgi:tRNA (guanine-N7-)-methyltransferase